MFKRLLACVVVFLYPFIWMTCSDESGKIRKWLGKYFLFMRFDGNGSRL